MNKYITLSIIILLHFFGCKKKEDVELRKIPANVRQLVPYTEGQRIMFSSPQGGSLQTTVRLASEVTSERIENGVRYKVEILNYKMMMGSQPLVEGSIGNLPVVFLNIWSPLDNYQRGGGFDVLTDDIEAKFLCNTGRQTCTPYITLNGKTFNNVTLVSGGTVNGIGDHLTKAWYTVDQGLIAFAYNTGVTYVRE